MPHDCFAYWGARARRLARLLDATTLRERKDAMNRKGRNLKIRPERPYEGWVHRTRRAQDHQSLVQLYFEFCLAVKQPTDIPNRHGCSALGKVRRTVNARKMGDLARKILLGLERDGKARDRRGRPAHREGRIPRYGTPNWLEEPPPSKRKGAGKKKGAKPTRPALSAARDLLESLRSSMDR